VNRCRVLLIARLFVCLPLTFVMWAQVGPATPALVRSAQSADTADSLNSQGKFDSKNGASGTVVSASDAVITIHKPCDDSSKQSAGGTNPCTTIVSKEAFEHLIDSMNVMGKDLTPEARRELAEVYAQYLAFETPATKAGLENTARFTEVMRWWRLRTLAGLYSGSLKEQFKNPSAEEVHTYYREHLSSFQRITVARILVPRTPGSSDEAKRADEKALEVANNARERVAKGEDPDLVQKDTYSALNLTSPPATNLGAHSRSNFPIAETDELFSLGRGQVSKVETEGASYVIYKVVSKETLPEESVKDEIMHTIAQNKYDEAIRSITETAKPEFNPAYFGSDKQTAAAPTHP
jgi:PPIC-type PPIASE domain